MEISREADTLRALYQNWTDQMVENPDLTIANLRSMFDEHCGSMEEDGDSREGSQYGDCAIADAPPCRFCGEAGCCAPPGECVPDLLGLLSQ